MHETYGLHSTTQQSVVEVYSGLRSGSGLIPLPRVGKPGKEGARRRDGDGNSRKGDLRKCRHRLRCTGGEKGGKGQRKAGEQGAWSKIPLTFNINAQNKRGMDGGAASQKAILLSIVLCKITHS